MDANAARALDALEAIEPASFASASPFPHIVIDGVFDESLIDELHRVTLAHQCWDKSDDVGIEVKWRSNWRSEYDIPEPAREMVRFFNSGAVLRRLSKLTGIPNLIADPYYTGGGFNLLRNGSYLDVHVDGNFHDEMRVHRRLNLILYLNRAWREDWGGALSFYPAVDADAEVNIAPVGGRLVVFETHDFTWHGQPEPIVCPEDQARTSIILYYYTAARRPSEQVAVEAPHSALWRSTGLKDKRGRVERV